MNAEAETKQDLATIFDDFFKERPASEQATNKGRLADLASFEKTHFGALYEPLVLTTMKDRINARLRKYGQVIQPPHGPATIHLDFVDSSASNGFTFVKEGVYFIAITARMLLDFERASVALTGRAAARDLLVVPHDGSRIRALCTAFLSLQLQFIIFHELGHIFHGHRDARSFREEYPLSLMDTILLRYNNQDKEQAEEFLADRYAVRVLLQDLVQDGCGLNMHASIGSALCVEECIFWLLVVAIGSVYFFGPDERFDLRLVRKRRHPCALARLNIVMRSIFEWAESEGHTDYASLSSSPKNFEWATSCIQDAGLSPARHDDWVAQGKYLNTEEGRDYLDILYNDHVVTESMQATWWDVRPAPEPSDRGPFLDRV